MKKRNTKPSQLDHEIDAEDGVSAIWKTVKPREGWAEAFAEMARHQDDTPLDNSLVSLSDWDRTEWEW